MRNKIIQQVIDETPKDVEIFVSWYAKLVVRINELIQQKKLTQKGLAEKLGKHPSEVHKWLNGQHNFTLRSLAKLQAELGETLLDIQVSQRSSDTNIVIGEPLSEITTSLVEGNSNDKTTGKMYKNEDSVHKAVIQ